MQLYCHITALTRLIRLVIKWMLSHFYCSLAKPFQSMMVTINSTVYSRQPKLKPAALDLAGWRRAYPQCDHVYVDLNSISFLSQITKGYEFESETDTEVIPKLIKYVYDNRESDNVTFSTLVERVIQQLVSSPRAAARHTLTTRLLQFHKDTPTHFTAAAQVLLACFVVTLQDARGSTLF